MVNRKFFRFASFCLVLCAVSSSSQYFSVKEIYNKSKIADIKSDQEWSNKDASNLRHEQMDWKHEIDAKKAGCSRYCIQETRDATVDSIKRVNIIWKIVDDSRVTLTGELSGSRGISGSSTQKKDILWEPTRISFEKTNMFSYDDLKCGLYLELGCEAHSKSNTSTYTLPDEFINSDEKTLVTMDLAEDYTENEFYVDEITEELRIVALGKLSQAILEIPIGDSTDARTPRPTLSLSCTSDGKGIRLETRYPPSGGWRLKLLGVENSNYSFSVVAASMRSFVKDSNLNVFTNARSKMEVVVRPNEKLSTPQRLEYLKSSDDTTEGQPIMSDDQQIPEDQSVDEPEMLEFSTSKQSFARVHAAKLTERKIVSKYPREVNLKAEVMESQGDDKIISRIISSVENPDEISKIIEDSELEKLSKSTGEIQTRIRKTVVDLSPNVQLIARPGYHDVLFTVTNNQALDIWYGLYGQSSPFRYVGIQYPVIRIRSGETIVVAVRIEVPNTQDTSPNTVTLYVGSNENFEVVKKSTYIYVQGSRLTTDTDKPSISYSFNDNCNGKLNRDRCARSIWTVEIIVKDSDSGLKTVTSLPKGVESRTEFIGGTRNSVPFYYVSTCCDTTVDVKATDLQGNVYTRTIDVTEWDNLSQGEIAAIVLGALLILLLIIMIILLIIYCVRKRNSHDLSYSQRYGSRTPASAERTNF